MTELPTPAAARPPRRWMKALALPALALAFVGVVALSSWALRGARVDLTQNRQYTLSDGTRHLLANLREPVKLELFYSEKNARVEPQFRVYAQRVRELIEEFAARSDGKVTLVVTDPEPFSEDEDRAASNGLRAVPLGASGNSLYFGLVGTNSTDGQAAMPFIHPDKENLLEYDLAKLVSTLTSDKKPVVALLSDLPTAASLDPLTNRPRPAWVLDQKLVELYDIRRLQPGPTSIGDDVDLLMLVHPKQLSDDTLYAIDQFVLRGGRVLAFVDPLAESDPGYNQIDLAGNSAPVASDLPRLFAAWGVDYDPRRVVLDVQNAMNVGQSDPNAPPIRNPSVLALHQDVMNTHDVVTASLETLDVSSAGALSLRAGATMTMDALVQSSRVSKLVDADAVRSAASNPGVLTDGFKADPEVKTIAARLSGPLKTAFPERSGAAHLAASRRDANIILVADTDLLSDRLWVDKQDFLGTPMLSQFANNADFAINAVDNLVGNPDLIAVRTRATANRPFERVEVIRRAAEQRYLAKEKQLQQQLEGYERKLEQLQPAAKDGEAAAPMGRAQRAETQQIQEQKLQTRRELRGVQRQLNAQIDRVDSTLKLLNILGMPLLVVFAALWVMWRRRVGRGAS
jgi:ABC-type uncharacterized transport system involved in gliding motility auxiliary subunit